MALNMFEAQRPFVEMALGFLRLGNTALDAIFYDVNALSADLHRHGETIVTDDEAPAAATSHAPARPRHNLDLSALANPEGAVLIVDTTQPPYVSKPYLDLAEFVADANTHRPAPRNLSITGVGSSALGSAAFAWNISKALGEPVAAIVPGYGLADVVQQALGGWFVFGPQSLLLKMSTQAMMAHMAPEIANIGHRLMMSAPEHAETENGGALFQRGSGSSDVLLGILKRVPSIQRLFGHSKGALVIQNALIDDDESLIGRLEIVTFGCAIATRSPPARLLQFLGMLDWLGWLNSWGNAPTNAIETWHSTNSWMPLSMRVADLARADHALPPVPESVGAIA
jgi:hypothetical protein